ncbi:YlxR family protein [Marisediminicola senii]|uniref:YlxR family protein n=1 Tax=Marisediminicola senii TaxID=2711233 RepID=UPI0013EC47EC|nr:YlxR family protein [Marisediminicola senii]
MEPVRTCLGCRQRAPKPSLLRFVVRDLDIVADPSATLPGRGAWVHPTVDCVDTALKRKAFGRALRNPRVTVNGDALRAHVESPSTGAPPEPPREQAVRPREQLMSND